jgi:small subunit ribosomal protein S3
LGRKVHPIGFRLGIIKDWQSRWFAEKGYTEQLHEDIKLRALVAKRLPNASISRVDLERSAANQIEITLSTAKPGIVIGKGGQAVEVLRKEFETATGKKVKLNINEIKQPELDAFLVAESIADQITRRVSYKRAMKQAILRAQRLGAKGIKVRLSGRLGGAEMARVVSEREGRVPLHTLRADIDYGQVHAHTTYGRVGVKVWIYRGDVIGPLSPQATTDTGAPNRGGDRDGGRGPRDNRGGGGFEGGRGPAAGGRGPRDNRGGDRGPRPQQPAQAQAPVAAPAPQAAMAAQEQAPAPVAELETNAPAPEVQATGSEGAMQAAAPHIDTTGPALAEQPAATGSEGATSAAAPQTDVPAPAAAELESNAPAPEALVPAATDADATAVTEDTTPAGTESQEES